MSAAVEDALAVLGHSASERDVLKSGCDIISFAELNICIEEKKKKMK